MTPAELYFLSETPSRNVLDHWTDLLPPLDRIVRATLFSDVILRAADGSIHLLEPAAGSCATIAASEDEFWLRVQADEDGWQLRPLADKCLAAGKRLGSGQCYAFTTLPLFGGVYEPGNIWVCSTEEWMAFTGELYFRTKDLPQSAAVELKIVD